MISRDLAQELALAMAEAIEARGGAVFVRCPVTRIIVDDVSHSVQGVALADGSVIKCTRVISGLGHRATLSLLPPPARPPLPRTQQSCGFIMANIALDGTAEDLGITCANMWVQPASEANGYDAVKAIDAFMADPHSAKLQDIPMGITFPSTKDRDHASPRHHACQILVPCELSAFIKHVPRGDGETVPRGDGETAPPNTYFTAAAGGATGWAKHAPPHAPRHDAAGYARLKAQWAAMLTEALNMHYPGTRGKVAFCDISTPLSVEYYLRSGNGGELTRHVAVTCHKSPAPATCHPGAATCHYRPPLVTPCHGSDRFSSSRRLISANLT